MATAASDVIELEDIGPVENLSIPLPATGGVIVLRGRNDIGKSEALKAVDALVSGRGDIEKRDGATRGQIRYGDAKISVSKVARRSGPELEISTIDSRLSLADLVNPGIKDPERADGARVKALVQLSGVTPDISLFYLLAGGQKDRFEEIVGPSAAESGDLVEMAGRVKRDFESAARKAADQSKNFEGQAAGCRQAADGYDPSIPTDLVDLHRQLEEAIKAEQDAKTRAAKAQESQERHRKAQADLERLEADTSLPSLGDAESAVSMAETRLHFKGEEIASTVAEIDRLTKQLTEQRNEKRLIEEEIRTAKATCVAVQQREQAIAACRANLTPPEDFDGRVLEQAQHETAAARKAIEVAAVMRGKAENHRKAEAAEKLAMEYRDKAEELRAAANAAEDVLSTVVGCLSTGLVLQRGRLVANVDGRVVLFAELSDGTRWKMAIDIGIEALRRNGVPARRVLLVIPQVAWSELDPVNKRLINQHAVERGVTILTAEATADEELRAEEFANV